MIHQIMNHYSLNDFFYLKSAICRMTFLRRFNQGYFCAGFDPDDNLQRVRLMMISTAGLGPEG